MAVLAHIWLWLELLRRALFSELHWVVNGAFTTSPTSAVKGDPPDDEAVWSLLHEVRVHKELLSDIVAFLKQVPGAPRAKFLLNVPDFIVHDEGKGSRGEVDYFLPAAHRLSLTLPCVLGTFSEEEGTFCF